MDMQDFEAWVARRDPKWYDQGLEAIYAMREEYSRENCLEKPIEFPKYVLNADMQQVRRQAKQAQMSLF